MKIIITPEELAEVAMLLRQVYGIEEADAVAETLETAPIVEAKVVKTSEEMKAGALVEEPEESSKPSKPRKNAIDRGRILALNRGGWSVKAIAEDVRCSEPSVRKVLREEAEREG